MGTKRPGREVNHSSSSNDEVKNEWRYTCSPTIRLHDVDRDSFTFFTGVLISPWPDLSPDVFCLMARIFRLLYIYIIYIYIYIYE